MSDESLSFDVVIVGAGPAGLSAAIRLKQLAPEISVCILEKGAEVGAHIMSGCVLEPRALNELLPDWQQQGAPVTRSVTSESFTFLTGKRQWRLPLPPQMNNHGNYIISLSQFTRWLATQAMNLGVEIFPGFAVVDALYDESGKVIGVQTGDMGQNTPAFQPGLPIYARHVLVSEGCRGSLAEGLMKWFNLRQGRQPQTYGLGLKEIWQVDSPLYRPGHVMHTIGWPLDSKTYGGGFVYHLDDQKIAVGFVVGLDYQDPTLSPFEEFQRFKTHPALYPLLKGGRRLSYGARAINEGGWQSIPQLSFPGGMLMGCSAGFLNVAKIKGTHTTMKSGMLAAEATLVVLKGQVDSYEQQLKESWVGQELYRVRNIRPGFQRGLLFGLVNAAVETYVTRGRSPWTLKHHSDHQSLKPGRKKHEYQKPDGQTTFDRLSSVYLCNGHHPESQPCHLKLQDPELAISHNYELYQSPETRYCPAGVYEIVEEPQGPRLQINAANCIHCKTCDIKDPLQNIRWTPPEGGSGPQYSDL